MFGTERGRVKGEPGMDHDQIHITVRLPSSLYDYES